MGDPATAALGGLWRLPTFDEFRALLNLENANYWKFDDGVRFYSLVSGYEGKTIFLRTAGFTGEDGQDKRTGYGLEGY